MSNHISFQRYDDNDVLCEEWILNLTERKDGFHGFRVCRYTKGEQDNMLWDEHYMFFLTLDVAYKAFTNNELKQGRANF